MGIPSPFLCGRGSWNDGSPTVIWVLAAASGYGCARPGDTPRGISSDIGIDYVETLWQFDA
ncbi:MAG: hypothetical protein AAFQ83_21905 [Bacteroidota bacterium]